MDGDVGIFFGIFVWVLGAAWLSRHVALDMDARGKAGWMYGLVTLIVPPVGAALWLIDRNRPAVRTEFRPEPGSLGEILLFVALVLTFPWGLVIWFFLNRRARPSS